MMKRSKTKFLSMVLAVMLITGVAGGALAWQGDGFKGEGCTAVGDVIADLPAVLQEQIEDAFASFRERLEKLRAEFHEMEAPRKDYREDFRSDREEAREDLLNELPEEVADGMREWRADNARQGQNGDGGMKRNQSFEGNRGGGGMKHHHQTNNNQI